MLEKLYQNKQQLLTNIKKKFLDSNSLTIKIGCELEFFLLEENGQSLGNLEIIEGLRSDLDVKLTREFPLIYHLEKEMGRSQFEMKTQYIENLSDLCDQIIRAKIFIHEYAKDKNLTASFDAQPFKDDCGNALQLNISLHGDDDFNSNQVIAGLLDYTNQMLPILAPASDDHLRFDVDLNRELHKKGKYVAPTYLVYGYDNRSAAIRLVNSRIEYRVACADADPYLVISAALCAILKGINEKSKLQDRSRIYGNAFDEQYSFKKIEIYSAKNLFIEEMLGYLE